MRRGCSIVLALCFLHLALPTFAAGRSADADKLARAVQTAARSNALRHATLAVALVDVADGHTLYAYQDERSLVPASTQKLLTTATALARLGANHHFTTRLLMQGEVDRDGVLWGDLYIEGGGDPLLGSYRYKQTTIDTLFALWTKALRVRGVQRIDGRVCYCSSIFDAVQQHDTWQHGDVGNYFGAGASGLTFHENMYFVHFNPGAAVGQPAVAASTTPKGIGVRSTNRVATGSSSSGDQVMAYGLSQSYERLYLGTVPLGKRDFRVRVALPDPPRTCATLFATHLRANGISVSIDVEHVNRVPDSVRVVSEYHSPDLRLIAQYTNHTSNNVYAECLFKYAGYARSGMGTFASGAEAVEDYIDSLGLNRDGVRVVDGSGLSRCNLLTANFLVRFLSRLATEPYFADYLATLPQAGRSGTARNLLPNLPVTTTVYVKTGTMQGVRTLAGYIVKGGRRYAFAIMANGYTAQASEVSPLLTELLRTMTETV